LKIRDLSFENVVFMSRSIYHKPSPPHNHATGLSLRLTISKMPNYYNELITIMKPRRVMCK